MLSGPAATPVSEFTSWLTSVETPPAPVGLTLKPLTGRPEIAHTGLTAVRIDFDSALSIETAWSGLVSDPYSSIQRPSQPVLLLRL